MAHLYDPFRVEERLAAKIQEAEYLLPLVLAVMLWTAGFVDLLAYRNAPGPVLGLYSWKFGLGLAGYAAGFVALYRSIVPDDSLPRFKQRLARVQARPQIGVPLVAAIVASWVSILFWPRWLEMPLLSGALLGLGVVTVVVLLWHRPSGRPREPWRRLLLAVFGVMLGAEAALQAAAAAGVLPTANTSGVTVPFGRIYLPGPPAVLATTNRYGWHAARFRLAPQGRRIAVMGDAVVQALDTPVRAHFATRLEAMLAEASPGPRPEVLTLGHPGFGPGLYADTILFPFSAGPFYPSEVVLLFQLADDLQVDDAPGGPRPFFRPTPDGRAEIDQADVGKRHVLQHLVIEGYGPIHPSRTLKSQSVLLHALDGWWRAREGLGSDVPPMPRHTDAASDTAPFGPASFAFDPRGGARAETALRVATGLIRHFQDALRARGVGLRVVTVPAFPRAFFATAPASGPWEPGVAGFDLLLPERRFAAMAEEANLAILPFGEWLRATGRTASEVRALFNDGGLAPLTPEGHAAMAAAIGSCFYSTAPADCPPALAGAARRPMPPPLAVPLPPGEER